MMIEQATVIRYQQGLAQVQCQAKTGCGSCKAQSACGTRSLSALVGEKFAPSFTLKVNEPLVAGDQIELGLTERRFLTTLFLLYGLPLLTLIGSTLLFSAWIENELFVVCTLLFCTAMTFLSVKKWLSTHTQMQFEPIFIRKL